MANSNTFVQGEWDWMKTNPYYKAIEREQEQKDENQWAKMMQMLPLLNRMDDRQMIGYGLGWLLKEGFLNWKKNYEERGERKKGDKTNPANWGASDAEAIKAANPLLNFPRLEEAPEGTPQPYNVLNKRPVEGGVMPLGQGNPSVSVTETELLNLPPIDYRAGDYGDGTYLDEDYLEKLMGGNM